jgi:hypothetical protein
VRNFFHQIPEKRRAWLALVCEYQLSGKSDEIISSADEADLWLERFLGVKDEGQQFGRLICLIAILDFELSPLALSRLKARAQHMLTSQKETVIRAGRHILDQAIPELKSLVDAWQDLRKHELDEASLWVYRDSMRALGMERITPYSGFRN